MSVWCLQKPEVCSGSPGTGVTDDCEPPCGFTDPNQSSVGEQSVVSIIEPFS